MNKTLNNTQDESEKVGQSDDLIIKLREELEQVYKYQEELQNQLAQENKEATDCKKILSYLVGQPSIASFDHILLVNSIPKSGTYLVKRLLGALGVQDSGYHLRNGYYWDFKNKHIEQIVYNSDQYLIKKPISESLGLVSCGEMCVAHLEYYKDTKQVLDDFGVKQVFLIRNLRDSLVSAMRFVSSKDRKNRPSWSEEQDDKKRFLYYMSSFGGQYLRSFGR